MIALLRFWFDIVLAFVAPRAALVAENLILRHQLRNRRAQKETPARAKADRRLELGKCRRGPRKCTETVAGGV